jgi:hypothetical protein
MTKPKPYNSIALYSAQVECEVLDVVEHCQPVKRGQVVLMLPHYSHNAVDSALRRQMGVCLQRDSRGFYSLLADQTSDQKTA